MSIWSALQAAEFPAVLSEVRSLGGWTTEVAEAVHAAVIAWCERALSAPMQSTDETAAALHDLLGRLRSAFGDDALDAARPGTAVAWATLEELLTERMGKLALTDTHRDAVMKRRHVPEVLRVLYSQTQVTQSELRERLNVSDSVLSQVLSRMEAAQLVVRERQSLDGRTRQVRLTELEKSKTAAAIPDKRDGHGGLRLAGFRRAS
jgi:DNA-binding MarR family transcriptional regulator